LSLERTYAGLVLADSIIAKAARISEVSQMGRVEKRAREFITAAWERRAKQATKKAAAMARQLKPASQIAAAVNKIMGGWAKEIEPVFLKEFASVYRLGRIAAWKKATRQTKAELRYNTPKFEEVKKADVAQLLPSFDLIDDAAVEALENQQVFWIGEHYKDNVSPSIAGVTKETMAQAGRDARAAGKAMSEKVAASLSKVRVPGGFNGSAKQYFEGLTANAMTVARVHGQMRSFMDIGITRYSISNPSDHRTCKRCAHMEGKVFTTKQGAEQMGKELAADSPEEVKAAHPWLTEKQIKDISPKAGPQKGAAGAKDAKALAAKGQALPPYHYRCRCTVDISDEVGSYESLAPFVAPKPGKPPVMIPPIEAVRIATPSLWAKGLDAAEKEAFGAWSGQDYFSIKLVDQGGKEAAKKYPQAAKRLKAMREALDRAPIHQGKVYRGMYAMDDEAIAPFIKKGNIVQQDSLSSWSQSKTVAKGAGELATEKGQNFLIMEVKTSKGAYDITPATIGHEKEVLLEKGKKLRVQKVVKIVGENSMGEKVSGYRVLFQEVDDAALPKLKPKPKPKPKKKPKPKLTGDDKVLFDLKKGSVVSQRRIGQGVNGAERMVLETPDGAKIDAVWKAAKNEEKKLRQGIKAGSYYRREAAYYRLDVELGGKPVTPPTIARNPKTGQGRGSLQAWDKKAKGMDDAFGGPIYLDLSDAPSVRRTFLMDVIAANDDRHGGNILFKVAGQGKKRTIKVVAIDNGLSFPKGNVSRFLFPPSTAGEKLMALDDVSIKQVKKLKLENVAKILKKEGIDELAAKQTLIRIKALQKNPEVLTDALKKKLFDPFTGQQRSLDKLDAFQRRTRVRETMEGFFKDAAMRPGKIGVMPDDRKAIDGILDKVYKKSSKRN